MEDLNKDVSIKILKKIHPRDLPNACSQNRKVLEFCSDKHFIRDYYELWNEEIVKEAGKNLFLLKTFSKYIDVKTINQYLENAIISKNISIIEYLAENMVDKNKLGYYLSLYVYNFDPKMMKFVLERDYLDDEGLIAIFHRIILDKRDDLLPIFLKYSDFNPSWHNNWAVYNTAVYNNNKILKMLLKDPRTDILMRSNDVLEHILRGVRSHGVKGSVKETIEIFLEDPRVIEKYGCEKFILDVLDCRFDYIEDPRLKIKALEVAAKLGNDKIVRVLLYKHQDDLKGRDKAIEIAKKHGHHEVAKTLQKSYL